MKKNVCLLFLLFSLTFFSCQLEHIWDSDIVYLGNVATFVDNGYSIPVFGSPEFGVSEIPVVNDKKMYQTDSDYSLTIRVVNPKGFKLRYSFSSESPLSFDNSSDSNILKSDIFSEKKGEIALPFKFKKTADKSNVNISLFVKNDETGRTYNSPAINAVYINSRPSKIIPKADEKGNSIVDGKWLPVVDGKKMTMYWNHIPSERDNDIEKLTVYYTIGGVEKNQTILYDKDTKKFGSNFFEANVDDLNDTVKILVKVYDNEGLDCGGVGSIDFKPLRAEKPDFSRINNAVTLTPKQDTKVFYKFDEGEYKQTSESVNFNLTKSHKIEYYSTKEGIFNSIIFTDEYTATYTVTFNGKGANVENYEKNVKADWGTKITEPSPSPEKIGLVFGGWYKETECVNGWNFQNHLVENDTTLYAKWIEIPYKIVYILNGGINGANPAIYNVQSSTINLLSPTRTGYTFDGWFGDDAFSGSAITQIVTGSTGDKTFYAKWIPTRYAVTYVLEGGINGGNPTTYNIESSTINLLAPTRTGYTFDGWFGDDAFSGSAITQIVTGSTGDKTFYAKWIENSNQIIEFNANPQYQTLVFTPSETTIAYGNSVNITTSANFSGATEWKWYEKAVLQAGATSSSYNFNSTDKMGVTVIYCTVKLGGITYSGTIRITVE